jgi:hypothetical protein
LNDLKVWKRHMICDEKSRVALSPRQMVDAGEIRAAFVLSEEATSILETVRFTDFRTHLTRLRPSMDGIWMSNSYSRGC